MSETPGTLVLLVITWTILLVAGISLIWQAIMEKSSLAKSKVQRILNEIKFRYRFATGAALIILVLFGVFWSLINW
jgi:hypothetical protein